jgi:hypothetical protein
MNYNYNDTINSINKLRKIILANKIADLSVLEIMQTTIMSILQTNTIKYDNIFIDSRVVVKNNSLLQTTPATLCTMDNFGTSISPLSIKNDLSNYLTNEITIPKNTNEKHKAYNNSSVSTVITGIADSDNHKDLKTSDKTIIKYLSNSSSSLDEKPQPDTITSTATTVRRKYGTHVRKKLIEKISNITNKSTLIDIYNYINSDSSTILSSNSNGIFINLNLASDNCVDKLMKVYSDYKLSIDKKVTISSDIKNKLYNLDDIEIMTQMGHKLSNQEKLILKRNKY